MPAPASPGPPGPGANIARVALVVGTTAGGTGAHVLMLATGLAGRGIDVAVFGPRSADAAFGFGAAAGVTFSPVEFGDRPRPGDVAAALRLRRLLGHGSAAAQRPEVVHAHGLRAGALAVLALAGLRSRPPGGRRLGLVVTVHNAPAAGRGARLLVYRLLESVVARGADLVLCVSSDLEERMRAAGARQVGRAIVPAPAAPPAVSAAPASSAPPSSSTTSAPPIPLTTSVPTTAPVSLAASGTEIGRAHV